MILDIDNRAYRQKTAYLPRTRDKKRSYLAALSDVEYEQLTNANIACYAACAREVTRTIRAAQDDYFNVFDSKIEIREGSLGEQEPRVLGLIDNAFGWVEYHATEVVKEFRKGKKSTCEVGLSFDFADEQGRLLVVDQCEKPDFFLRDKDWQILTITYDMIWPQADDMFTEAKRNAQVSLAYCPYEMAIDIEIDRVQARPDAMGLAEILKQAYRSAPGYKAGATVEETINLNFG
jgi:hypothetical protein